MVNWDKAISCFNECQCAFLFWQGTHTKQPNKKTTKRIYAHFFLAKQFRSFHCSKIYVSIFLLSRHVWMFHNFENYLIYQWIYYIPLYRFPFKIITTNMIRMIALQCLQNWSSTLAEFFSLAFSSLKENLMAKLIWK